MAKCSYIFNAAWTLDVPYRYLAILIAAWISVNLHVCSEHTVTTIAKATVKLLAHTD